MPDSHMSAITPPGEKALSEAQHGSRLNELAAHFKCSFVPRPLPITSGDQLPPPPPLSEPPRPRA